MHPALVRGVIDPLLQRWSGSRVTDAVLALERTQWESADRVRDLQWTKMRALLAHAQQHVPYYRALFASTGIRLDDLRGLEDLASLPVLSKEVVRDRAGELRATGASGLHPRVTSGSTGVPLQTYIDTRSRDWLQAAIRRARRWWGVEVGDRVARLTTSQATTRQRVRLALLNERRFPCADLSEPALSRLHRDLGQFHPAAVRGSPHTLAHFAAFVLRQPGPPLRPKVVICSAELLYRHQRAVLFDAFQCPVVDQYGTNESGLIAVECPSGRMHIVAENVLVEFRPVADAGGMTELIVTDLNNWGMPLIRYAVGDLGRPIADHCPCGRGLPLLELRAGRTGDFVVLPDGRVFDHSMLCAVFEEIGSAKVQQYRIIQEALDRFTVLVVGEATDGVASAITRGFHRLLGPGAGVEVTFVAQIPRDPSGKLRLFESRVR